MLSLMQLRAAWQFKNINQKESSRKNVTADAGSSEGEQEKFLLPLSLFFCFLPNINIFFTYFPSFASMDIAL